MKDGVMILYQGGEGEITEKRSRFIATTHPVKTEDEAEAFVEQIRKKYYDARHNCFAWIIGEEGQNTRLSDDGEPSQTAGLPILNVLKARGIVDACIVVTRYFGGTLLGTGGLFRAYTKAAEAGLEYSIILEKRPGVRWKMTSDYADLGKIQNIAEKNGLFILGTTYTDKVETDLLVPYEKALETAGIINEKTGGRVRPECPVKVPYVLPEGKPVIFEDESLAIEKN